MKVVLFNGSPKANGCTHRALLEMVKVFDDLGVESQIIQASFDKKDILDAVEKVKEADAIVLSSPVYYASATGLACYFYDEIFNRCTPRLKVGAAVVSSRRAGSTSAFERLNMYFTISEMIVASSFYWNEVHGSAPSEVERDEEGLQSLRTLARNMVYISESIKKASLALPEREKRVRTNFIR